MAEEDPQLTAIAAKLDTLNATQTAMKDEATIWHSQSLFLLEAQAIALGILWGCFSWLLIESAKRWRSPFW